GQAQVHDQRAHAHALLRPPRRARHDPVGAARHATARARAVVRRTGARRPRRAHRLRSLGRARALDPARRHGARQRLRLGRRAVGAGARSAGSGRAGLLRGEALVGAASAPRLPPGKRRAVAARRPLPQAQAGDVSLSPTMPAMISATLASRSADAGSANSTMPSATVPTAPIPTQTLYAVPTSSDFTAILSSHMLTTMAAMVQTLGQSRVKPCVYFSPTAQPTSRKPAG